MASTLGILGNHLGNALVTKGTIQDQTSSCFSPEFLQVNNARTSTKENKDKLLKKLQLSLTIKQKDFTVPGEKVEALAEKQTDTYLLYLYRATSISASRISNVHAFINSQNPITPVALWVKMLFIHITLAANKIRHHS